MNDFAPLAQQPDESVAAWGLRLIDDLTTRHQQGQDVPVETYFAQLPDLAAAREIVLDLLVAEWTLRRQAGERLALTVYVQRFPALAEEIRLLWEVDQQTPSPLEELTSEDAVTGSWPDWYTEPVALPVVFGAYHLVREFSGGGMARVFLAEPLAGGSPVALKVPRLLGLDARAAAKRRQRFLREARLAHELAHPRLCRALEVGDCDGLPYFTMPFYPGGSLSEELQSRGPFAEHAAARLVADVARVLQYAHEHKVLHRDLKPSNLLRDEQGQVIVTDLGLALALDDEEPRLSASNIPGTALYLSPEQAAGERHLTPASDVFSLGVVLYELLTGKRPFAGSLLEVLSAIKEAAPAPLERLRPDVSPALAAICRQAMARKPDNRYPSMTAFADDLERFLSGTWNPPPETPPPPAATTIDLVPAAPRSRRRWWAVAVGVGLAVVLVCGLVLWAVVGGGTPVSEENDGGTPAVERPIVSTRSPIGLRGQLQLLHDDLAGLDAQKERPYMRYFSLMAVHDNPYISDSDLNLHLDALKRVLKRLSKNKVDELVYTVGDTGCLVRIDLRDLGWDVDNEWRDLLKVEPYGVRYDAVNPDKEVRKLAVAIVHLTSKLDPLTVRADWFIEAATRAPLYDHLQQTDPKERRTPPFDLADKKDSVARVVQLYRMKIDARVAAAELGLGTVAAMDVRWPSQQPEMRKVLDLSLPRSQWAGEEGPALFADCVKTLKLGVPRATQALR